MCVTNPKTQKNSYTHPYVDNSTNANGPLQLLEIVAIRDPPGFVDTLSLNTFSHSHIKVP